MGSPTPLDAEEPFHLAHHGDCDDGRQDDEGCEDDVEAEVRVAPLPLALDAARAASPSRAGTRARRRGGRPVPSAAHAGSSGLAAPCAECNAGSGSRAPESRSPRGSSHTLTGVREVAGDQNGTSASGLAAGRSSNGAAAATGPVQALAEAGRAVVDAPTLAAALDAVVTGAARATGAELVLARALDADGCTASVRAVHARSAALAAELEGSPLPAAELAPTECRELDELPEAVRAVAARAGLRSALQLPVLLRDRVVGTLELFRAAAPFTAEERVLARLAAAQVGAALRIGPVRANGHGAGGPGLSLSLAGDALAAGFDEGRTAEEIVRLAAEATGARRAVLWSAGESGSLDPSVTYGAPLDPARLEQARELAESALAARRPVALDALETGETVATIPLGPAVGSALQLSFTEDAGPADLTSLATFGVRAAHALRSGTRAHATALELERTRSLMTIVAEANAQLSLAHTLATFVDRVAELLAVERIAVYLRDDDRLLPAAGRALGGPHGAVAERLLALALGRFRSRGVISVADCVRDRRFAGLERELAETGIDAAVAVPLVVPGEVIGLLAAFPGRGVQLDPNDLELLTALAAQLAVAVQNARLHEQATELGVELEQALAAERKAAARVRSLYEISRSFAQSLSLETTLDAVASSIAELLGVDAAVIRMPDERGELLVPRAIHVADDALRESVQTILSRPQRADKLPGRRNFRSGRPLLLDADTARMLGPPHSLLAPFLEKGSTAVVLPIATPTELLGTLKLLSLDPARPITAETIELGLSVAAQAALAIENARLYQQQKALLRRDAALAAAARGAGGAGARGRRRLRVLGARGGRRRRVRLRRGRRRATRSRARRRHRSRDRRGGRHGDGEVRLPLAGAGARRAGRLPRRCQRRRLRRDRAGQVHHDALPRRRPGARRGRVRLRWASEPSARTHGGRGARHRGARPRARHRARSAVRRGARDTAAGSGDRPLHGRGPRGAPGRRAVRAERLDELLAARRELPPRELAQAVLDACRSFAGGELSDDCAVVVVKRAASGRRHEAGAAVDAAPSSRALSLLVFGAGTGSLAVEICASRLLAPYYGSSTIVWANLIGLVLLALSLGYWLGGKLADRHPEPRLLGGIVVAAAVLVALIPFVTTPILDVAAEGLDEISAGAVIGSFFATLFLFAPPVLLLGMVAPFAIRLAIPDVASAGAIAGRLYALSTAGSLLGTFVSALVLIPAIGTQRTLLVCAAVLALSGAALLGRAGCWWARRSRR